MSRIFLIISIASTFLMNSCIFLYQQQQQQQQMYAYQPMRWCYIMCIKHATKEISVNSLNNYGKRLSLLSLEEQQKTPEFRIFSNFGQTGTIVRERSWLPDITNTLHFVVNEITLQPGEEIEDFNGFIIKAKNDCLLISNGKINYKIKEKKDWSEIESEGGISYGGHLGPIPISEWQFLLWSMGLRDNMWDYHDPKNIKPHRYLKWCLSPIDDESCNFEIYTMYVPNTGVVWRKRKVWYDSTWE